MLNAGGVVAAAGSTAFGVAVAGFVIGVELTATAKALAPPSRAFV
jgi:hypothetical protein